MALDDSVVVTAPSVEEAIIVGLTRLVATRDEVEIEVLDEGSRGFLGIGAREARVRLVRSQIRTVEAYAPLASEPVLTEVPPSATPLVTEVAPAVEDSTPIEPVAEPPAPVASPIAQAVAPQTVAPQQRVEPREHPRSARPPSQSPREAARREESRPRWAGQPAREESATVSTADRARLSALAAEMVANMLPGLEIEATAEWVDEDRPTIWVSLTGRDADALVGPRARNLHALQYLLRALLYHQSDGNYNVVVDADGYRKRRRRSLETMARAKADQAVAEGRMVRLRPMPPHERRIVHIVLRDDNRVTTESVGKGHDRAVTIVPRSTQERA